ncbi:MAG: hypothetical protein AA908_10560 [Chlorobi bacterium NICIL-2]|nr:MAG: hypothetical protein AA908_10560 [Chlorobi bacterium NICIL-2]
MKLLLEFFTRSPIIGFIACAVMQAMGSEFMSGLDELLYPCGLMHGKTYGGVERGFDGISGQGV